MKRRDFLKTAALVPMMNWEPPVTITHRPTVLEKAIAAYHWPLAKKGLGDEMLCLSRKFIKEYVSSITSLRIERSDDAKKPYQFTVWCNVRGHYYGLRRPGKNDGQESIEKKVWAEWFIERLYNKGFVMSGIEGDCVNVRITNLPNNISFYHPTLNVADPDWSYTNCHVEEHKPGQFTTAVISNRYYKNEFPKLR